MSTLPMNHDSYGAPVLQDISRQRKLAEQLRTQSEENIQGQMVSGHYVAPHWTQQLARLVNAGTGAYISNKADKSEKDYAKTKAQKLADFIKGNQAQTTQQGTTETSTIPAYDPSQMDRFGSPQQGVERQPVVTSTPNMVTETPDQVQARQRAIAYQLAGEYDNPPEIQMAISDMNHQRDRGEHLGDRKEQWSREDLQRGESRQWEVNDKDSDREFQRVMAKDAQGFQLTMQEKNFVQQVQMQKSGFAHDDASQRRAFGHSENMAAEKAKGDAKLEKGTYDQERGVIVDTRTGEARPVTQNGVPFTAKLPEAQQKQVVGVKNLGNAITEYKKELSKWSQGGLGIPDIVNPDKRAAMGTKYNNMMLQAKEAYNLGVLNGPDLDILTSVVTDPRSGKGMITSNKALENQASELDRIMRDVRGTSSDKVRGNDKSYQVNNIIPQGESMPNQDAGYLAWKKANGK